MERNYYGSRHGIDINSSKVSRKRKADDEGERPVKSRKTKSNSEDAFKSLRECTTFTTLRAQAQELSKSIGDVPTQEHTLGMFRVDAILQQN